MLHFNRTVLDNGLRVLVHEDHSSPMVAVNVMYDVGARDEDAGKTGFAHLFEHLMFGGSVNIPDYDEPLQKAGGENNAYTTNDLTNYYCSLPAENLEVAFWLESDRMLSLAFSEKSLDTQRKVVCEEFKQHYINKPYGDIWAKMRELAYTVHPYQWMTIGKELSHIENATIEDVKAFFQKHYCPVNAVLVVAGNVSLDKTLALANKWFGPIPGGKKYLRDLPKEPRQTTPRILETSANVPLDALMKTWHIGARLEDDYYVADLLTEILGGGGSSRLYQSLVKEQQLFSNIECYHFGSHEPGLITIEGKLVKGVSLDKANEAVEAELKKIKESPVSPDELQKVKHKTESIVAFEDMGLTSRAGSIANYELLGDAHLINTELEKFQSVTADRMMSVANLVFDESNTNTLYYKSTN